MRRWLISIAMTAAVLAALGIAGNYGAALYYSAGHGSACADCHEMTAHVSAIHSSSHRNATCTDCHEASIATKLRHVRVHISGGAPEAIRLREADVRQMMSNCQGCHQREYASWHAGPHSATYSDIFVNTAHNTKRRLMDDCFRCHGMYFDGAVRDIVQPQNTTGPWRLTRPELAGQPTIPCQACHWIHSDGAPEAKVTERPSVAGPPVRDSVALFDHREQMHFAAARLAIPGLYDGARALKVSPDPRQAICYQCHAPRQPEAIGIAATNHWGPQAGSGDDRTPMGVHEGLSCLACHNGHGESAVASCATCHPQLSHCGIAVEKMDTTFANRASKHNIHWVKCGDCHEHGVPQLKKATFVSRLNVDSPGTN
ncbi:MAG TPA: hypothetical protein VGG85_09170 [Terracidiphilus sp.]|jgi:hypothetical protein